MRIETPRIAALTLTIEAAPVVELPGAVVLSLQRESIALKLDHQLTHRNAARSVTAMAAKACIMVARTFFVRTSPP